MKKDNTKLRGYWKIKENNMCKVFFCIASGYKVSFGGDANVLKLDYGDGCITLLNILKNIELYILNVWILW